MAESNGEYVRTADAAAILHVAASTINRWTHEGRLPHLRTVGGQHLYPVAELRALAASLREDTEVKP